MITEITRQVPFQMSITTDGTSIVVHSSGGLLEGMNFRGEMLMQRTMASQSPIVKDFIAFCQKMTKKYKMDVKLPFANHETEKKPKAKTKKNARKRGS